MLSTEVTLMSQWITGSESHFVEDQSAPTWATISFGDLLEKVSARFLGNDNSGGVTAVVVIGLEEARMEEGYSHGMWWVLVCTCMYPVKSRLICTNICALWKTCGAGAWRSRHQGKRHRRIPSYHYPFKAAPLKHQLPWHDLDMALTSPCGEGLGQECSCYILQEEAFGVLRVHGIPPGLSWWDCHLIRQQPQLQADPYMATTNSQQRGVPSAVATTRNSEEPLQ